MDGDCYRHVVAAICWRRSGSPSRQAFGHQRTFGSWCSTATRKTLADGWYFQHGWSLIIAALLNHQLLPVKSGRPEAWPRLQENNEVPLAACAVGGAG